MDVSADYSRVAGEEATRLGQADRVRFIRGTFVQLADEIPTADVVTLDRVICCYPDMETRVSIAAQKSRQALGAVYPRDVWRMRVYIRVTNAVSRLRRSAFRSYLHSPAAIENVLRRQGLERTSSTRSGAWEIAVYERRGA